MRSWGIFAGTSVGPGVLASHPMGRPWPLPGRMRSVRLWNPGASQEYRRLPVDDGRNSRDRLCSGRHALGVFGQYRSGLGYSIRRAGSLPVRRWLTSSLATLHPVGAAAFLRDCRTVATGLILESAILLRDVRHGMRPSDDRMSDSRQYLGDISRSHPTGLPWPTLRYRRRPIDPTLGPGRGPRARGVPIGVRHLSLDFSPDGRTLYAGCSDHAIKRWDVSRRDRCRASRVMRTGSMLWPSPPTVACWPPGSTGHRSRLWDLASGKQIGDPGRACG